MQNQDNHVEEQEMVQHGIRQIQIALEFVVVAHRQEEEKQDINVHRSGLFTVNKQIITLFKDLVDLVVQVVLEEDGARSTHPLMAIQEIQEVLHLAADHRLLAIQEIQDPEEENGERIQQEEEKVQRL